MNKGRGIELTLLLSSGESLFIKIDSLKDRLNALFSEHKIEKLLNLQNTYRLKQQQNTETLKQYQK